MGTATQIWARRIREWKRSGLSAREFAAANGLNGSTLSYWKWRLTKEARTATPITERPRAVDEAKFVEVTPPSSWWRASDRIEIVIDGEIVVRVPHDFDERALGRVLRVLGALEDEK